VAPRKPQHHCLRSPRSESKSFNFHKQAYGVKLAIKEAGKGGGAAAPLAEPEEVSPPLPEEVKRLKPPRRKVSLPLCAPKVNFEDACFSVKMLYQAWKSLGKVAVQLGVQRPTDPL
jgi:hypothetical protein